MITTPDNYRVGREIRMGAVGAGLAARSALLADRDRVARPLYWNQRPTAGYETAK